MKERPKAAKPASSSSSIWTLKIKLVLGIFAEGPWEATVEIDSSATLADLHSLIQKAVQFDNDHLFMFYVARTFRSRERSVFDPDEDKSILDVTLEEIFPLPRDRRLFYWFDFGDDWRFSIARTRAAPKVAEKGKKYPRVAEMLGERPEQYPAVG